MKKVLVTGKTGYIGSKFKEWIEVNNKDIKLEFISVRDDSWKTKDFSKYDTILHLAGIAHVSRNPKLKELYYKVNRDLTMELAKKAKIENVKQFIFMSSIIIYGKKSEINNETIPKPVDFYGESKLEAEKIIIDIYKESNNKLNIIRTPMVYGEDCKGNYKKLSYISRKNIFFPSYENKRSMIYIENLCIYINQIIENNEEGIHFPQNKEYISTKDIVKEISLVNSKKHIELGIFNPLIKFMISYSSLFKKIFGDLYYEKTLSEKIKNLSFVTFRDSIVKTELKNKLIEKSNKIGKR